MTYRARSVVVMISAIGLLAIASLLGIGIDALLSSRGLRLTPKPEREESLPCYTTRTLAQAQRQVKIMAGPKELALQLNLTLPRDAPCVHQAFSGELRSSLGKFVSATFGDVYLEGQQLKTEDLNLAAFRESGQSTVLIQIERRYQLNGPVTLFATRHRSEKPASDELLAILQPGVSVETIIPVPDIRTPEMLSIRTTQSRSLDNWVLTLAPSRDLAGPAEAAGDTGSSAAPPLRETRQEFLGRFGTIKPFPVLASLLSSLHYVLPLLLAFLWIRNARNASIGIFDAATGSMLLFYASFYILRSLQDVADSKPCSKIRDFVADWIQNDLHLHTVRGDHFPIATSVILGIAIPVLITTFVKRPPGKTLRRGRRLAWGVLLLVAGASAASGLIAILGSPAQPGIGLLLLILADALLLYASLLALIFQALCAAPPALAPVCALVTAFLKVLHSALYDVPKSALWLVATCLLGAFLIRSLFAVFSIAAQTFLDRPAWFDRKAVRLAAASILLLTALPLPSPSFEDLSYVGSFSVSNLAFFLLPWVLPIWLTGGLAFLYKEGKDRLELSHAAHALGLLALSTMLFSPRIYWFYLPVTFLLGWLTLDRVLVRERSEDSIPGLSEILTRKRPLLFEAILDRNVADQAVRSYRRKKLESLLSGELDFDTYEKEYDARLAKAESIRQRAMEGKQDASDLALALAPHATAWANGIYGALFGALFGLPWIYFGLASLLHNSAVRSPHPLLDLGSDVVLLILRWATAGFLLGYFFPYIRGRSGLTKGFYLFLALTIPTIPLAVIQNTTAEELQPFLFLYLQTFIHCMLLGLFAFDLAALRQAGFRDWRFLFELHGLPALGISLSSLAVAIGAAITTLLSSQLSSLVGAALRVALPAGPHLPP
jgi:hypothetical protein